MKKYLIIFLFIVLLFLNSCNQKINNSNNLPGNVNEINNKSMVSELKVNDYLKFNGVQIHVDSIFLDNSGKPAVNLSTPGLSYPLLNEGDTAELSINKMYSYQQPVSVKINSINLIDKKISVTLTKLLEVKCTYNSTWGKDICEIVE